MLSIYLNCLQLKTSSCEDPSSDTLDGGGPDIFPKSPAYHVPYFTVLVSILELLFFLYYSVHLSRKHCMEVTAGGPVPLCSALVYNPNRRYEVSGESAGDNLFQSMNSLYNSLTLGLATGNLQHDPQRLRAHHQ